MRTSRAFVTGAVGLVALLTACSTTKVTNSWRSPTAQASPPKKALVLAMVPDQTVRLRLESEMAEDLEAHGVKATPAGKYFPEQKDVNQNAIRELARREGFDGILITRFRGVETEANYSPPVYTYGNVIGVQDPWVYDSGYVTTQTKARLETSLFRLDDGGKLVWSAMTEQINPSGSAKETARIADKVVEKMKKDAVL